MFLVDSVDEFYQQNAGKVHFLIEPHDIPQDPHAYVAETSRHAAASWKR